MHETKTHTLEVVGNELELERVSTYLPTNYIAISASVNGYGDVVVIVIGYDVAGWTYEDYVKPRLASGNMFASCKLGEHDH